MSGVYLFPDFLRGFLFCFRFVCDFSGLVRFFAKFHGGGKVAFRPFFRSRRGFAVRLNVERAEYRFRFQRGCGFRFLFLR